MVLKRSKIEKWVDEPFLKQTLLTEDGGQFVRVRANTKYVIAEVRNIREDWNHKYRLSSGKTTGV